MHRLFLAVICGLALALRVVPRWDAVLGDGGLRLADPDGWHHLRLVEQWVRHFPHRMVHDPYFVFPAGGTSPTEPLFDAIAATLAWAIGLGAPSEATVHRVLVLLPAVFGALTCFPAFALGRRVGGTAGGLCAALATACLPGQLLVRSMLGFADHHALETLLAATTVALFAAAIAAAGAPRRNAFVPEKVTVFAATALALSILNWGGATLLVVALASATALAAGAEVLRTHAPDAGPATSPGGGSLAVALVWGRMSALAFAIVAVFSPAMFAPTVPLAALAGTGLAVVAGAATARALLRRGVRPVLAVAGPLAFVALVAQIAAAVSPQAVGTIEAALSWFSPTATRTTVAEARPLWMDAFGPSVRPAWVEFGVPGVVALAGVWVLALRAWRCLTVGSPCGAETRSVADPGPARPDRCHDHVLLAVLIPATIAFGFVQTRFAANAAVAVAVAAGAVLGPWLGRAWRGELRETPGWLGRGVWPFAVTAAFVLPSMPHLRGTLAAPPTPGENWREVLLRLRDETPEPFAGSGGASVFESLRHQPPSRAKGLIADYGVLSWWDAGYWITQIARRVPIANPTQAGASETAKFLLETDPERIGARADALGARYVIVSSDMPVLPQPDGGFSGLLPSIAAWAGRPADDFVRAFRNPLPDGTTEEIALFLPEYFRTACVRLHTFGGRPAAAAGAVAIEWAPGDGDLPVVIDSETFASWDEAQAWVASRPAGRACAGSLDPFLPCVALTETPGFREFAVSSTAVPVLAARPIWHVQAWERVPPGFPR